MMSFLDIFKPVTSWSAAQVREFLEKHVPEEFNLVDVRRPSEYEKSHLPGARSVPVDDLQERIGELDPALPTITYCTAGVRSRAAAATLQNAGFHEVYNMAGGIRAWEGEAAEGSPEPELAFFRSIPQPEKQVALAWHLEEGAHIFYQEVAAMVQDREVAALFRELVEAEEKHKITLLSLYEALTGKTAEADFPRGIVDAGGRTQLMEGGMEVAAALEWTRGRQVRDILELAIGLETNAYDRYLTLRRELGDENSRRVFEVLSDEERRHLKKLTRHFEHFL
jgi:rhodanese-related sulfurtransferase/rubrerythrin